MSVYICPVCGHVEFPETSTICPVCRAAGEAYNHDNRIFEEPTEKSQEDAT